MDFSEWLSPDDVTEKLVVGVFGPSVAIVAVFILVSVVGSWLGSARFAIGPGRGYAATAYRAVMRIPAGTVITVLLVALQAVWLWSASRIAHGLSYLWHQPFGTGSLDLDGLTRYESWDWISTLYLMASVAALLASYASVFGSGGRDVIGGGTIVLALPLLLPWGLFCLVGSLFALTMVSVRAVRDGSTALTDDGRAYLAATLIVLSYTVTLHLALSSTRTIARYWSARVPEPAS